MKKILSLILAVAALGACADKQPGYVIKGQAGDLDGKAVLAYALPDGTPFSDTVAMNKGKFTFKGSVPEVLIGSVALLPAGEDPLRTNLYVENCPLTMKVNLDKVIDIDQSPIGRTPRSNPATYTGVFSDIRSLFVGLPEAKIRGYKPGRFSFNVKGGRCETCGGNGYKTIEMNFLPDIQVPCEECHGKRYNRETLEVRYKGKSIADVLDMTINQAVEFFENVPDILRKIKTIQDVGLGYIKLGQPSTTLSGGESQRVKLAAELSKKDTGRTLYILDEPTTGLHFEDIRILMQVLRKLVDRGNTVIVIEHNLDVICQADHIIDMGPEGGRGGGTVLSTGTPEEIAESEKGYTPRFVKAELESHRNN